ncbi:kinetochore Sim4 complex subunit FTA2-domain-containing protein [Annulohypoxylon moriforme]|nr:kinetochore Sim4 complex subunit FTA2-domain-containing protein [Annulohypoxylon moriforme]
MYQDYISDPSTSLSVYPDWPESEADLLPLPNCKGPRLQPFMFHGPQNIKFLECIGHGTHSHVFKVRIKRKVYALKLFRFVEGTFDAQLEDPNIISVFAGFGEPFYQECRAYARLQETGHEDLATKCFGYLLLSEENERSIRNQFSHLGLEWLGDPEYGVYEDLRSLFPGKSGRKPPIRGILKEFGQRDVLTTRLAKKILQDVIKFQQLGIFQLDVAERQIINGKLSDFSIAITTPHFITNPELNPNLNPDQLSWMEFEVFKLSSLDYWRFDDMIYYWNQENNDKIAVFAFPGGGSCVTKYNLRRRSLKRFYTFVDPRKPEGISKKRKLTRWYHVCTEQEVKEILDLWDDLGNHAPRYWEMGRDGYISPVRREFPF